MFFDPGQTTLFLALFFSESHVVLQYLIEVCFVVFGGFFPFFFFNFKFAFFNVFGILKWGFIWKHKNEQYAKIDVCVVEQMSVLIPLCCSNTASTEMKIEQLFSFQMNIVKLAIRVTLIVILTTKKGSFMPLLWYFFKISLKKSCVMFVITSVSWGFEFWLW